MRDLAVDFNEQTANMTPAQRKAAWEKVQEAREARTASERSKQYMGALRGVLRPGRGRLRPAALVQRADRDEVSGYDRDEAQERIASGGKLSDAKELKYAIYGPGTKEQRIRDTLKGKSKAGDRAAQGGTTRPRPARS